MANRRNTNALRAKKTASEIPDLPWKTVIDWPSQEFIDDVLRHLKDTAQPETLPTLYRNKLAKNTEFRIVKKDIVLDGKKRPNGDDAPCPMCTPNKFLTCSLVYLPSLKCCAVIGHCCADKETAANAEREYKLRTTRDYQENYLLTCLPLVADRMKILESLRPSANEALRLYRKFKNNLPQIHSLLRSTKHQYRGHLILSQIISSSRDDDENDAENDYVGPAGIKGRGSREIQTREHNYGLLSGAIAVHSDFHPVKELEWIQRRLASVETMPTEEAALEFICSINEKQRNAAVVIMESVDVGVRRYVARVKEFLSFFTLDNARVLNAFGSSEYSPIGFSTSFETLHGRPSLRFKQGRIMCRLDIGPQFAALEFVWPSPSN